MLQVGCPDRKNRKIVITFNATVRFFDMLCKIVSSIGKNKWQLPSGALFALWRQIGVPTYFFRSFNIVDDFT